MPLEKTMNSVIASTPKTIHGIHRARGFPPPIGPRGPEGGRGDRFGGSGGRQGSCGFRPIDPSYRWGRRPQPHYSPATVSSTPPPPPPLRSPVRWGLGDWFLGFFAGL